MFSLSSVLLNEIIQVGIYLSKIKNRNAREQSVKDDQS